MRELEALRRANKRKASAGSEVQVDEELQAYDYFNRSPDDATSHERRYKILLSRLN